MSLCLALLRRGLIGPPINTFDVDFGICGHVFWERKTPDMVPMRAVMAAKISLFQVLRTVMWAISRATSDISDPVATYTLYRRRLLGGTSMRFPLFIVTRVKLSRIQFLMLLRL